MQTWGCLNLVSSLHAVPERSNRSNKVGCNKLETCNYFTFNQLWWEDGHHTTSVVQCPQFNWVIQCVCQWPCLDMTSSCMWKSTNLIELGWTTWNWIARRVGSKGKSDTHIQHQTFGKFFGIQHSKLNGSCWHWSCILSNGGFSCRSHNVYGDSLDGKANSWDGSIFV